MNVVRYFTGKRMMDKIDLKLLAILAENAKATYVSIGKKIHLSPSAVFERIKKLEEDGVIYGYVSQIDLSKMGIKISALIECTVHIAKDRQFFQQILLLDEVIKIYKVTGVSSYVIEVGTTTDEALLGLIDSLQLLSDTNSKKIAAVYSQNFISRIKRIDRQS